MQLTTNYIDKISGQQTTKKIEGESIIEYTVNDGDYFLEKTQKVGRYFITYYEYMLNSPITISLSPNSKGILMLFLLEGEQQLSHHLIRKVNKENYMLKIDSSKLETRYISVLIPKEIIIKLKQDLLIDFEAEELPSTLKLDDLIKKNKIISPEMKSVITDIYSCQRDGSFKQVYLENKIIELLFLQLEYINQDQSKSYISNIDIERMHSARKLLTQNIKHPYTLSTLAKKVGTNEFKLKKYFKELFGSTVFGYLNEHKMNKAKERLQNSDITISELAEDLGYKSQNHFSTVFKKFYGYPPSDVKKVKNINNNRTHTIYLLPLFIIEKLEVLELLTLGTFIL
ncbi:helix-turn-helix domain-containing protein [Myroides odoratimimus]|uniref:helix-turn-helix domain-containing protein n=1 Tax=Myroides odoratimimus TaxID=76832 RepID=UPI0038D42DC5